MVPEENSNSYSSSKHLNLALSKSERTPTFLDYVEYVCITWFTLELVIKFLVCPKKLDFFKSFLNWIDLAANLWFYIDLIYNYFLFKKNHDTHPAWDLFGTIRIMRLFRLFDHYPGLKIIIVSLKASAAILRLLVFFIIVAVVISASLIYYSEKLGPDSYGEIAAKSSNENHFSSIFEAIWFSIASLTTVGFGDYCPRTPFGMIFGAMCTVAGVLMIDLPMPIIVANFANYYHHLQARSKFPKKLRRRILPAEVPRLRAKKIEQYSITQTINNTVNIALMTTKLKGVEEEDGINSKQTSSTQNKNELSTALVLREPRKLSIYEHVTLKKLDSKLTDKNMSSL